jgi:two-component system CheB/CheR fusion protein
MTSTGPRRRRAGSRVSQVAERRSAFRPRGAIVGIGVAPASVGAACQLLRCLPDDTGLSLVVVPDLRDQQRTTALVQGLARSTAMPVVEASNDMRLEPDRVHVIPAGSAARVERGRLMVRPPRRREPERPIEHFLRSLARAEKSRAIGLVLAGAGPEAEEGLEAIRAVGGTALLPQPIETLARELAGLGRERDVSDDLLAASGLPIVALDGEDRVRRFTPAARSLMGLEIGEPISDADLRFRIHRLDQLIANVRSTSRPLDLETTDSAGHWWRLEIRPCPDVGGRSDGVILVFTDIDRFKRSVHHAHAAFDQTSAMQRAVPVPLLVLDDQLSVRSANPAYYERFAAEPADTLGRPWLATCGRAWNSEQIRDALASLLAVGGEIEMEVEIDHPPGNPRNVVVTACALRREHHAPLVLVTLQDVTERTRLLHAAEEARSQAERANDAKDVFFAMLSHELRAPLHTIMLHADLLLAGGAADPIRTRQSAEAIVRAAESQAGIISDLLDVSAIIAGKISIKREPVDLQPVVSAALDAMRDAAADKRIRLRADVSPEVGPVLGDDVRLQQITVNLLANAVKFTPPGGEVSIALQQEGERACIQVMDTGKGIAADLLPRVFDRFVQGEVSVARAYGGLGLGLTIVKDLVRLHGGTVQASSEGLGRGATFTVEIPLMAERADADQEEQTDPGRRVERAVLTSGANELDGLRVLLVDDDPGCREVFSAILRMCGAEVKSVASAADVVPAMNAFQPDVLLCDIAMPDEDGYSLIRRIRRLAPEQGGRVPAVAVTALATRSDRRQALSAGFQVHVAKPAPAAALIDALQRARNESPVDSPQLTR